MIYYADNSATQTCDFAWSEIENGEKGVKDQWDSIEMASEAMRRVQTWVYSPPCDDVDGFVCRSILASWIFVPELRHKTMSQIARRFGKKKQSLGRWAVDFKREFPDITNHIKLKL